MCYYSKSLSMLRYGYNSLKCFSTHEKEKHTSVFECPAFGLIFARVSCSDPRLQVLTGWGGRNVGTIVGHYLGITAVLQKFDSRKYVPEESRVRV